ncbi:MAG: hypothetical protein ACOC3D_09400 [Pseudomonadota bacterium]
MNPSAERHPSAEALLVVAAWVAAGLNLELLFDLKATATTLAALVVLTVVVLVRHGRLALVGPILAGLFGAGLVFAGFVVHPAVALGVLMLVLVAVAALAARALPGVGLGARLGLAAGFSALVWPPFLGLLSNAVVEVFCPAGGVETACHGFYRVGFEETR